MDWSILCFAYKWLDESRVYDVSRLDFKDRKTDRGIVKRLHELFDEADVVVAHNGVRFDQPKVRARLLVHGFDPPSPVKEFDTVQVARRQFGFHSNRLDDLGRQLGVGRKLRHTGFDLWLRCMAGTVMPGTVDPAAWRTMLRYNRQDVRLLEDVYRKLRPWSKTFPNLAAIDDKPDECPRCGVRGQMLHRGWTIASVTRRPRFQCKACGGWCSGRAVYRTGTSFTGSAA